MDNANLYKVYWNDVRGEVEKLNPSLYAQIEKLNPGKDFYFYRVKYRYGDKILDNGCIHLPLADGKLVASSNPQLSKEVVADLDYSLIPIFLLLNANIEVFAEPAHRIAPVNMLQPGSIVGLWESFSPDDCIFSLLHWFMTAGARSIFFLPKISDNIAHKRLMDKYGIRALPPKNIFSQWDIFRQLANKSKQGHDWCCEILLLPKQWLPEDPQGDWLAFRYYLLNTAWEQTKTVRAYHYSAYIWENISQTLSLRNIKPTQNQIFYLRYLVDVANGIVPGFRPVTSENNGPLSLITNSYVEDYRLSQYPPILFAPTVYQPGDELPVYSSLSYPTLLHFTDGGRTAPSTISELRRVIMVHETMGQQFQSEQRPLFDTVKAINYQYYHSEADPNYQIHPTSDIINDDWEISDIMEKYPRSNFPDRASFLRGCISMKIENR